MKSNKSLNWVLAMRSKELCDALMIEDESRYEKIAIAKAEMFRRLYGKYHLTTLKRLGLLPRYK